MDTPGPTRDLQEILSSLDPGFIGYFDQSLLEILGRSTSLPVHDVKNISHKNPVTLEIDSKVKTSEKVYPHVCLIIHDVLSL